MLGMLGKLAVMDWFKMPSPYFLGEPEEVHEKRYSKSLYRDWNLWPPGYVAGGIATRLRR